MKKFFIRLGTSISQKLPCLIKSFVYANGELTLNVDASALSKVLFFLKYHTNLQYKVLVDMTAVDYPTRPNRFDVVYHLLSIKYNTRIRVKTVINELDSLESMTNLYNSAG
jgi:NADH dehydrogenase (ubiquinone) Fe-S protein 3